MMKMSRVVGFGFVLCLELCPSGAGAAETSGCAAVDTCRKTFIANGCESFGSSGVANTCGREAAAPASFAKITASCQGDVQKLQARLRRDALPACAAKLGLPTSQDIDTDTSSSNPAMKACLDGRTNVNNPGNELATLDTARSCLSAVKQSQLVCAAVNVGANGADAGFSAKSVLLSLAGRSNSEFAPEQNKTISSYGAASSKEKERLSNEHLDSLVDTSLGGVFKTDIQKLGLREKPMTEGILDSDEGKILEEWNNKIIAKSKTGVRAFNWSRTG